MSYIDEGMKGLFVKVADDTKLGGVDPGRQRYNTVSRGPIGKMGRC